MYGDTEEEEEEDEDDYSAPVPSVTVKPCFLPKDGSAEVPDPPSEAPADFAAAISRLTSKLGAKSAAPAEVKESESVSEGPVAGVNSKEENAETKGTDENDESQKIAPKPLLAAIQGFNKDVLKSAVKTPKKAGKSKTPKSIKKSSTKKKSKKPQLSAMEEVSTISTNVPVCFS